jgi:tripartite-type tricarboxylate transporter receptor subunit TctC
VPSALRAKSKSVDVKEPNHDSRIANHDSPDGEAFPARAVRIVVPFGAGPTEVLARWLAEGLSRQWGQPVGVESHPGQGGMTGTRLVAKAAPDGYTLLAANPGPLTVAPGVKTELGYDPAADLLPVVLMVTVSGVVAVRRGLPASDLEQLIDHARGNGLRYGSAGAGTVSHLAMEWLNRRADMQMEHVPCDGLEAAVPALVSGNLDVLVLPMPDARPLAEAGKIRALAVTRRSRSALWPDLPTVEEAGVAPFESFNWNGLAAPAGTPLPVVFRIGSDVNRLLSTREASAFLGSKGYEIAGGSADVFGKFMHSERAKWREVAKLAGLNRQD